MTDEARWTPGPWEVIDHPQVGIFVRAPSAIVENDRGPSFAREILSDEEYPEKLADARLIAAAPELYDGARNMERLVRRAQDVLATYLDPGTGSNDPNEAIGAVLEILDHKDSLAQQRATVAALAKAERGAS